MARDLVGRERELVRLRTVLDPDSAEWSPVTLLRGEAGIGKSALVARLVDEAVVRGVPALVARADRLERGRPLAAVRSLFDVGLDRLLPQPPDDRWAPDDPGWMLGAEAVVLPEACAVAMAELVGDRATPGGLLVVEDLQWADPWTLAAVGGLLPVVRDAHVSLLVTARSPIRSPRVSRLLRALRHRGSVFVDLGPLADADVLALARDRLGGEPVGALRRLLLGARGHALLVTELLRGLTAERVSVGADTVDLVGAHMPDTVAQAVEWWLDDLDEPTLQLLSGAAVLGTRFEVDDLAAVVELDAEQVTTSLLHAAGLGVVVERGDALAFRHELVREALYERLPGALRRRLHARALDAPSVIESGAGSEVWLEHRVLGSDRVDDELARTVLDRAGAVRSASPDAALGLVDALHSVLAPGAFAVEVDLLRAELLARSGHVRTAEELLRGRLAEAPADRVADHRATLAAALLAQNRLSEAAEELGRAEQATLEPVRSARLAALAGFVGLASGRAPDLSAALAVQERADELDDPVAGTVARSVLARVLSMAHAYRDGLAVTEAAVELADAHPDVRCHLFVPWFWHGLMCLDIDDHEAVAHAVETGRARAVATGSVWSAPLYHGLEASVAYRAGRLDQALAACRATRSASLDTGCRLADGWTAALAAEIHLLRGEIEPARIQVEQTERASVRGGAGLGVDHLVRAGALWAEIDLDPEAGTRRLAEGWDLLEAAGASNCLPVLAADLVRLAGRVGDHDRAAGVTGRIEVDARSVREPRLVAVAARCRGLLDRDAAALEVALAQYRRLGRWTDAALVGGELAVVCARRGYGPKVRDAWADARSELERLGAVGAVARFEDELHAAGVLVDRTTRPDHTAWAQLTGAEQEVALLVGEGLSNRAVADRRRVSVRTVEAQLTRIYTKLGLDSRTQLVIEALRRSEPAGSHDDR